MTAATDPFDGLALAPLGPGDAGRGAALSAEIGWNQNRADWSYMLANGFGSGRSDVSGKLVGSAMALPYGAFAWVCMVLVSPDRRRRGIATDLMGRVLDGIAAAGSLAGLDATPAGREVYRRLGFVDVYGIKRLWAAAVAPEAAPAGRARIATLTASDIGEIAGYDAGLFGGDRAALLAHLVGRVPGRAHVARVAGRPAGYVLAREGRQAMQIGPLVAAGPDIACALARHALDGLDGPVVIDCPDRHASLIGWLERSGFAFQRPYIRMLRGRAAPLDEPDYIYALAGPELG